MAVVLTNGSAGQRWMNLFRPHARFFDVTGHIPELITADEHGWGSFRCPAGSVTVRIEE